MAKEKESKKDRFRALSLLPNYCFNCGHHIAQPDAYVKCADIKKGPFYCPHCGKEIYKEK